MSELLSFNDLKRIEKKSSPIVDNMILTVYRQMRDIKSETRNPIKEQETEELLRHLSRLLVETIKEEIRKDEH